MIDYATIVSNINYYKAVIEDTKATIRALEDYLQDLNAFLATTRSRQNAYYDNQGRRNSELGKTSAMCSRVQTADRFYAGMFHVLNGPGHIASSGNFDGAISRINTAIRECQDRITTLYNQLRKYESSLSYWQSLLASISFV